MFVVKAFRCSELCAWEKTQNYQLFALIVFLCFSCLRESAASFSLFSSRNSPTLYSARLDVTSVVVNSVTSGVWRKERQTLLLPQEHSSEKPSSQTEKTFVDDGFISKFEAYTGTQQTSSRNTEVSSPTKSGLAVPIAQIVSTTQEGQSVQIALQTENRKVESTKSVEDLSLKTTQFSNLFCTITDLSKVIMHTSSFQESKFGVFRTSQQKYWSRASTTSPHFIFFAGQSVEPTKMVKSSTIYSSASSALSFKNKHASRTISSVLSTLENTAITSDTSTSFFTSNPHVESKMYHSYVSWIENGRSKLTFLSQEYVFTATGSRCSTGLDTSPGAGLLTSSQGVEILTSSTESQRVSLTLNEQFPLMVSSTFRTSSSTSVSATTSSFVNVPSSSTRISSPTAPVSTTSQTSFQVKISPSFTRLVKSRVSALSTLSTDNIESREKFLTTATSIFCTRVKTASSFSFSTSVQSLSTNSFPSQDESVIACKVKNTTCLCYNCEEAHVNVAICCMDLIDIQHLQHGVIMNMTGITVWGFYQKLKAVSSVIAEEVMKSCQENPSLCVNAKSGVDISGKRKKRSLREVNLKNNLLFERMRFKREALRRDENPAMSNVSHLDVIIYNISSRIGQPSNVETTFFVSMMLSSDGTNQTVAVDGKGLLEILRNKKRTLENKLNISIDSFAASKKGNNTPALPNTSMLNSSGAGNSNMTPQSSGEGRHLVTLCGQIPPYNLNEHFNTSCTGQYHHRALH